MGCDAVVMEKVIRVATTAILSIEPTAAFVLWLMASLWERECRLRNQCGLHQPF